MRVLVSYWITSQEKRPRDIILDVGGCSLNTQAIEEIRAKIAERRVFGLTRYHVPKDDVTILGITKLDE